MKKILDYIEVEFENMDNVYLPTKYFRELILNDVRFNYKLLTNGCMREVMVSYDIYISLKPEANIASLNMSKDGYFFDLKNGDLFERLKQNDILIIKLHYKDNIVLLQEKERKLREKSVFLRKSYNYVAKNPHACVWDESHFFFYLTNT